MITGLSAKRLRELRGNIRDSVEAAIDAAFGRAQVQEAGAQACSSAREHDAVRLAGSLPAVGPLAIGKVETRLAAGIVKCLIQRQDT